MTYNTNFKCFLKKYVHTQWSITYLDIKNITVHSQENEDHHVKQNPDSEFSFSNF
jgi:hypothetical protein